VAGVRAVTPSSLEPLRASHQAAVATFVSSAQALSPAEWDAPLGPGKWSPAQVAEHLRLSYVVLGGEADGGEGLRIRTASWIQPWLRFRYLRRILSSGTIPAGARSPREARPGDGPFDRSETLAALSVAASAFEDAIARRWENRSAALTHHVFGRMPIQKGLRFATVHTQHHTRQISR
jgi:hypothetical protein